MARVRQGDLAAPPSLQDTLQVSNTFAAPSRGPILARPGTDQTARSFREIAEGLAGFNPALRRWAAVDLQSTVAEEQQAADEAYAKTQGDFDKAVKQGLISAEANPFAMQRWRILEGSEVANIGYMPYLYSAWQESGLATQDFTTEAEAAGALQSFIRSSRRQFLEANNLGGADQALGFSRRAESVEANLAGHHTRARLEANSAKMSAYVGVQTGRALQVTGWTAEQQGAAINAVVDDMIARGMDRVQANDAVVEAVMAEADMRDDTTLLDALDHVRGGTGPLGNTADAKRKRANMVDELTRREQDQARFQEFQREITAEQAEREAFDQAVQLMLEDPTADITAQIATIATTNDAGVNMLLRVRDGLHSYRNKVREDPEQVAALYAEIYENPENGAANREGILAAFADQRITRGTMQSMLSNQRQAEQVDSIVQDPNVRHMAARLKSMLGTDSLAYQYDGARAATYDALFREGLQSYRELLQNNPEATEDEKAMFMQRYLEGALWRTGSDEAKAAAWEFGSQPPPGVLVTPLDDASVARMGGSQPNHLLYVEPDSLNWEKAPLFDDHGVYVTEVNAYNAWADTGGSGPRPFLAQLFDHLGIPLSDTATLTRFVKIQTALTQGQPIPAELLPGYEPPPAPEPETTRGDEAAPATMN